MDRPRIISHMITSVDGRLHAGRWTDDEGALLRVYEGAAEQLDADGWIIGRRTMQEFVPAGPSDLAEAPIARPDHIVPGISGPIGICIDRSATIRPETGDIEGDHLVLILSARASEAHVERLKAAGVSILFAGPDGADLEGALSRLRAAFGADRLLLEGGGRINGAFLEAGLIDETSTLIFPAIDAQPGEPSIFEAAGPTRATALALISAEALEDGTVWLRHKVKREDTTQTPGPA